MTSLLKAAAVGGTLLAQSIVPASAQTCHRVTGNELVTSRAAIAAKGSLDCNQVAIVDGGRTAVIGACNRERVGLNATRNGREIGGGRPNRITLPVCGR